MGVVFTMCQYVLLCVVFVVLLVASVLASMRWLLCGGDGSKKKDQNEICNFNKKCPAREVMSVTVFIFSKNALNFDFYRFN